MEKKGKRETIIRREWEVKKVRGKKRRENGEKSYGGRGGGESRCETKQGETETRLGREEERKGGVRGREGKGEEGNQPFNS